MKTLALMLFVGCGAAAGPTPAEDAACAMIGMQACADGCAPQADTCCEGGSNCPQDWNCIVLPDGGPGCDQ
jgi:hypothetical protein